MLILAAFTIQAQTRESCVIPERSPVCKVDLHLGEAGGPVVKNEGLCASGLKWIDENKQCEGSETRETGVNGPKVIGYFTPVFSQSAKSISVEWKCPDATWSVRVTVRMGGRALVTTPLMSCVAPKMRDKGQYVIKGGLPSNLFNDPRIYATVEAQDSVCQRRPLLLDATIVIPESYAVRLSATKRQEGRVLILQTLREGRWRTNASEWKQNAAPSDNAFSIAINSAPTIQIDLPSFQPACPSKVLVWRDRETPVDDDWIAELFH